jgi:hypothetical protein
MHNGELIEQFGVKRELNGTFDLGCELEQAQKSEQTG